jgi:hypothetical protein
VKEQSHPYIIGKQLMHHRETVLETKTVTEQRPENEKEIHYIKIAETKLKNVSSILRNPPASLSES